MLFDGAAFDGRLPNVRTATPSSIRGVNTSKIERLRKDGRAVRARVVLFDFDGTLSLIRSGWMEVMIPMMVEILADASPRESESELRAVVEGFVWRLTGEQTIYQMIALANEIEKRGSRALDPLAYKRMYLDRLARKISNRLNELRQGHVAPDKYLVPGARRFLQALVQRGLRMYLASGTDEMYVKEEARLLDVARYFDGGVFGALDDYKSFSKAILIQRIISTTESCGGELVGFGDGYVEIENIKRVGGVAVGVATSEPECDVVDNWKRKRLAEVGADFIVPNYLYSKELLEQLFPGRSTQ